MGRLQSKVAIVTGASAGIGRATARLFASEGARVVVGARRRAELDSLVDEIKGAGGEAVAVAGDVRDEAFHQALVRAAVDNYGRLDIAFNNAGVSPKRTPLADLAEEAFDAALNTNVRGIFIAMKHEIRAMLKTGGGSIVNTGSVTSTIVVPHMAAYCTSKHALAGLTKAAALDYAAQNIRVNLVAPGPVDTQMLRDGAAATEQGREMIVSSTPMRRISRPEEIAAAVVWVASSAASYLTGAILPVDGGYTLP